MRADGPFPYSSANYRSRAAESAHPQAPRTTTPRMVMTHEQMLQERLIQLLMTIKDEDTSDLLIAEYSRIHEEVTRLQDRSAEEKQWK